MTDKKNVNLENNMLSDDILKEVKLSDDALEQVSGGYDNTTKKAVGLEGSERVTLK